MNIYNNGNLNMWINTFSMPIQSSFSNHPSVHLGNHLLRQIWHSKSAFLHVISLIYYYRLSLGKKMTVAVISETLPSIKSSSWFVRKASILLLAIQNTWTFVLDLVTTRTNDKISLREIGGKVRTYETSNRGNNRGLTLKMYFRKVLDEVLRKVVGSEAKDAHKQSIDSIFSSFINV